MFSSAARIAARPAVAAAAAAVTANAAQGTAHARAPPSQGAARQAAHPPAHSKIVDRDAPEGWIVADLQDDVVLFQPFNSGEVEHAASTVMAMWSGRSIATPIVTEPQEEEAVGEVLASYRRADSSSGAASDSDSDARLADAVIEAAAAGAADAVAQGRRQDREQLERLMEITTRMLKRPGMQREVVMCMLEDPEVRQLMLRQCNDLDRYLQAAGIHEPKLLPHSDGTAAGSPQASSGNAAPGASNSRAHCQRGGPDLMSRLAGLVAGALEKAGDALAAIGNWLRRYVAEAFGGREEGASEEQQVQEGAIVALGGRPQRSANQVLGGVMVLAVSVFCVMLIRKPLVLRMLRR